MPVMQYRHVGAGAAVEALTAAAGVLLLLLHPQCQIEA
jgi:hypothetical protein